MNVDAREVDLCVQQREKDGERRPGNESPALLPAVGKIVTMLQMFI